MREKAEAVIKIALPLLTKNGIAPSVSTKLVGELTGGLLERFNLFLDEESTIPGQDKPALAIRVWGAYVVVFALSTMSQASCHVSHAWPHAHAHAHCRLYGSAVAEGALDERPHQSVLADPFGTGTCARVQIYLSC
jgi:hypothetical protein